MKGESCTQNPSQCTARKLVIQILEIGESCSCPGGGRFLFIEHEFPSVRITEFDFCQMIPSCRLVYLAQRNLNIIYNFILTLGDVTEIHYRQQKLISYATQMHELPGKNICCKLADTELSDRGTTVWS